MIDTGTQSSSVFQIISFYMDSTVLLIDYQLTVMSYVVIINQFNQLSIVNVYHINQFNKITKKRKVSVSCTKAS